MSKPMLDALLPNTFVEDVRKERTRIDEKKERFQKVLVQVLKALKVKLETLSPEELRLVLLQSLFENMDTTHAMDLTFPRIAQVIRAEYGEFPDGVLTAEEELMRERAGDTLEKVLNETADNFVGEEDNLPRCTIHKSKPLMKVCVKDDWTSEQIQSYLDNTYPAQGWKLSPKYDPIPCPGGEGRIHLEAIKEVKTNA